MNKKHVTLQITVLLLIALSSGCSFFRMPKDIAQVKNETSAIQKELTDLKSSMDDDTQELNAGIQANNNQLKDEISSVKKQLDNLKADSIAQSQKLNEDIQKNDSQLKKETSAVKEQFANLKSSLDAQNQKFVATVQSDSEKLKKSISALDERLSKLDDAVQANNSQLKKETSAVKEQFASLKSSLDAQKQKLSDAIQANNDQAENYKAFYKAMNTQKFYWIIAVLVLLVGVVGVFFLLKNKMTRTANALSSGLITRLEELKTKIAQPDDTKPISDHKLESKEPPPAPDAEPDHSLPIKVCEEIQRMRNRMKHMDPDDQATKVFGKRLTSLEEALNEKGYEMANLENSPYNDGMTIEARFISDENLKKGEKMITKVIKPQINYKDVLLRIAEVEVSQGV